MRKGEYKNLTREDYLKAKEDDFYLNKVYEAHMGLIDLLKLRISRYPTVSDEDYLAILSDGLVNAIMNFNPDMNYEFSTFAMKCMVNEVHKFNKKISISKDALNKPATCSLDALMFSSKPSQSETDLTIKDTLSDQSYEDWREEMMQEKLSIPNLLTFFNKKRQILIKLLLSGYRQSKCAEMLDYTRQSINIELMQIRKIVKNLLTVSRDVNNLRIKKMTHYAISQELGLKNGAYAEYYDRIYQYLYLNGEKPEINEYMLRQPYKITIQKDCYGEERS